MISSNTVSNSRQQQSPSLLPNHEESSPTTVDPDSVVSVAINALPEERTDGTGAPPTPNQFGEAMEVSTSSGVQVAGTGAAAPNTRFSELMALMNSSISNTYDRDVRDRIAEETLARNARNEEIWDRVQEDLIRPTRPLRNASCGKKEARQP